MEESIGGSGFSLRVSFVHRCDGVALVSPRRAERRGVQGRPVAAI